MISRSPFVHNADPGGGMGGRGDGGGGVGVKQSEEVKSVNLPNTFDSYSSYGSLIFRNVCEWKGSQRYTGSFQTM